MPNKRVIEIVGFPGSGKSYIINQVKHSPEYEILDEDKFYYKCKNIGIGKKIKSSLILAPKLFKIHRLLLKYETDLNILSEMKNENKSFYKYYVLQNIIINEISNNCILFDQWNIQYVMSLALSSDRQVMISKTLKELLSTLTYGIDYYMFFYDVDIDTSITRIKKRNNKFRMDSMSSEKLKYYYSIHRKDYINIGHKLFKEKFFMFSNKNELEDKVFDICRAKE